MKAENKRKYERVNTFLPLSVRRTEPEEREACQCQVFLNHIVVDAYPPPPVEDERLNSWLNMINTKLDYLISRESPTQQRGLHMDFEPLNISGSGMMMVTRDEFQAGDFLEIRIVMQTYPAKILYLYGEVIRIEGMSERPGFNTVGIKFQNISEEVRSEIVKFNFKKHGEKLKMKNTSRYESFNKSGG